MSRLLRRMAVFGAGATIATVCFGVTVRAAIGLGPLFAVQDGVAHLAHITLGRAVMVVGVAVLVLMVALGKRPGPGTFVLPFLQGALLDLMLAHLPTFGGWPAKLIAVVLASWLMCLGGAMIIEADLGISALDGVMLGIHRRTGRAVKPVRLAMEATMLVGGWLLGGSVGVGTVITGLMVGTSMQFWMRVVGDRVTGTDVIADTAMASVDW